MGLNLPEDHHPAGGEVADFHQIDASGGYRKLYRSVFLLGVHPSADGVVERHRVAFGTFHHYLPVGYGTVT